MYHSTSVRAGSTGSWNLSILFTCLIFLDPLLFDNRKIVKLHKDIVCEFVSTPWIVGVIINKYFLLCEGPKQQRTYIGWVNNFGDILVGGIDHQTGKLLPEVTIKKHLNKDDHANPSIMILQVRVTKIFTYSEVLANTIESIENRSFASL